MTDNSLFSLLPFELRLNICKEIPLEKIPIIPELEPCIKYIIENEYTSFKNYNFNQMIENIKDIQFYFADDDKINERKTYIIKKLIKYSMDIKMSHFMQFHGCNVNIIIHALIKYKKIDIFKMFYHRQFPSYWKNILQQRLIETDLFKSAFRTQDKYITDIIRYDCCELLEYRRFKPIKFISAFSPYYKQKYVGITPSFYNWLLKNHSKISWKNDPYFTQHHLCIEIKTLLRKFKKDDILCKSFQ